MINHLNETLIPFSKIPSWTEENLGTRISPNTAHRWRLVGCRGIKLSTILIGGTRCTSVEALQAFFEATTLAQDGHSAEPRLAFSATKISEAESYLESEGI